MSAEAAGSPKAGDDLVEMIRLLRVARGTAIKARTQAINALRSLLVTAPPELREQLRALSTSRLVGKAAQLRPGALGSPLAASKLALRHLARRCQTLEVEIRSLDGQLARLTTTGSPQLIEAFGVGADTAGALLALYRREVRADRSAVARLRIRWSMAAAQRLVQDDVRYALSLKSNALELGSRSCARYFDPATYSR